MVCEQYVASQLTCLQQLSIKYTSFTAEKKIAGNQSSSILLKTILMLSSISSTSCY